MAICIDSCYNMTIFRLFSAHLYFEVYLFKWDEVPEQTSPHY